MIRTSGDCVSRRITSGSSGIITNSKRKKKKKKKTTKKKKKKKKKKKTDIHRKAEAPHVRGLTPQNPVHRHRRPRRGIPPASPPIRTQWQSHSTLPCSRTSSPAASSVIDGALGPCVRKKKEKKKKKLNKKKKKKKQKKGKFGEKKKFDKKQSAREKKKNSTHQLIFVGNV
jgi:hypothetical protein